MAARVEVTWGTMGHPPHVGLKLPVVAETLQNSVAFCIYAQATGRVFAVASHARKTS